ncbi:MAG: aminomethyl-transferring glycine dehydrogenase [Actinomycetales bacterium]|nr:aminomethyl-transferring glycine dehydrogenase [Actinomycetales bacterium]
MAGSDFAHRHIGPTDPDTEHMLRHIGVSSVAELLEQTVPAAIHIRERLNLPEPASEHDAAAELAQLARLNTRSTSMLGLGYHPNLTPPVILRNILENPAWYTAYTPYQPEISQGRLTALLNFQTMIEDLTGLPIAGASLLDEPTAAAEAMTLSRRAGSHQSHVYAVDVNTHPQTLAVLQVRALPLGITVASVDFADPMWRDQLPECFGVLVSYPGSDGAVRDVQPIIDAAHEAGAMVAVTTDLLALCLLTSPGSLGADIVVGSAQRFGVPMGFGGPHAGFMSVRSGLERMMPGRLVGVSVDADGAPALRLALQTREQHIRREKATSNICTAQVLLAVMAGMYAAWHGPQGLTDIARRVHEHAADLASRLRAGAVAIAHTSFFDTVTAVVPGRATDCVARCAEAGILIRELDADRVSVSCNELTTGSDVAAAAEAIIAVAGSASSTDTAILGISAAVLRQDPILAHPVFSSYRSETEMLRYLRRLADQDIALDRSMIPLGSCTMKLNATSEMQPVTDPQWADIHPFAPAGHTEGYTTMISQLEQWLCEVTGYDAVSVQPNAGSQGEFAGLLAIAAYHRSRGDLERDVCLIPSSAHGTNAASAVMAGMRVVVVGCDERGNVDVEDLAAKVAANAGRVAALMITYPSTHGVFESAVSDICAMVHDAGGQVYVDGANLNALVGLAKPGKFGADVSHLNLHKTFCIPHGGGGPGVGPVAVRAHLAPFLPSHPLRADAGPVSRGFDGDGVGPISGAPWGSAGILPIPWMYIRMMGAQGLLDATSIAIVSANYIAARLREHYPVLYTGASGFVAHECILDLREITKSTGVTVDDVAKRLMDYGFHAPTMSFPVAGTLMVEPTESEPLAELDRFCDAMIAIRGEIDAVAAGVWPVDNSPLRNAPHTAVAIAGEWDKPYDRMTAAFPPGVSPTGKYWPPVRRVDGAYGDRNLVCSCPDPRAFESV